MCTCVCAYLRMSCVAQVLTYLVCAQSPKVSVNLCGMGAEHDQVRRIKAEKGAVQRSEWRQVWWKTSRIRESSRVSRLTVDSQVHMRMCVWLQTGLQHFYMYTNNVSCHAWATYYCEGQLCRVLF